MHALALAPFATTTIAAGTNAVAATGYGARDLKFGNPPREPGAMLKLRSGHGPLAAAVLVAVISDMAKWIKAQKPRR